MKHPTNWIFAQLTPKPETTLKVSDPSEYHVDHYNVPSPLASPLLLTFSCRVPSSSFLLQTLFAPISVSSHLLTGCWTAGNTAAQIVPICCAVFLSLQNVLCKIVSSFILTLTFLKKKIFGVVRKQEIKRRYFPCTGPRIYKVRMWNGAAFRAGKGRVPEIVLEDSGAYHVPTSAKIHF